MSRGYNARRKAKRQQARAVAKPRDAQTPTHFRPAAAIFAVLAVVVIFVATALLGLGASNGSNRREIDQQVTSLLAGIPQHETILGSPKAKTTIRMFTDLECLTVRGFVYSYLPFIINTWVRTGAVKLEYRSLETDTTNERTFYRQEEAAWAAGQQNRLWNFALTFVHQQGQHFTEYATGPFLAHIASQVSNLNLSQWNRTRKKISLFNSIAFSVNTAHAHGLHFTPSFIVSGPVSNRREVVSTLENDVQALRKKSFGDLPIVKVQ